MLQVLAEIDDNLRAVIMRAVERVPSVAYSMFLMADTFVASQWRPNLRVPSHSVPVVVDDGCMIGIRYVKAAFLIAIGSIKAQACLSRMWRDVGYDVSVIRSRRRPTPLPVIAASGDSTAADELLDLFRRTVRKLSNSRFNRVTPSMIRKAGKGRFEVSPAMAEVVVDRLALCGMTIVRTRGKKIACKPDSHAAQALAAETMAQVAGLTGGGADRLKIELHRGEVVSPTPEE